MSINYELLSRPVCARASICLCSETRQAYLDEPAPLAKREGGCRRAYFPAKFKDDAVELPAFGKHLDDQYKTEGRVSVLKLSAGRALGFLETDPLDVPMQDVKVLVGFFLNDQYNVFVGMPLMGAKFRWTSNVLEGFVNYANYWIYELSQMIIKGEEGPLENYKECLKCLIAALKSGHAKRCSEHKEKGYRAKAKEDGYVIKNFPSFPKVIQPGVRMAYCVLFHLAETFAGEETLPRNARGLANAAVTGAWSYDTYMGRKWEIEHILRETVREALNINQHYVTCSEHKCAPTYGDIVKLLTTGLEKGLEAYDSLPRQRVLGLSKHSQSDRNEFDLKVLDICLRPR